MQLSRRKKCLELLLSRRIPAAVAEYLGIPEADEVPLVARVPPMPEVNPLIQAPRLHNQQWTKCQSLKSFSSGSTGAFSFTERGFHSASCCRVYTWGWKECVPSGKVIGDLNSAQSQDNNLYKGQNPVLTEQGITVSLRSQGSRATGVDGKAIRGESKKRRRVSSTKQVVKSSSSADEPLSAFPCLVALNSGVRIATVTAGRFHTGPGSTSFSCLNTAKADNSLSLFSHNACVTAVVAAMNSDSHNDSDTVACFCVLQLIGDLP
nr:hypothetical protein [Tanacetum cinerariifolium]